ncbi:MAG TPA: methylmalonyl-CoA epimerase [Ignavibacteria bacterium]|nr:methylmalonyl-CoA epimerase [Ignavibacteria bacterium]
MLKLNHLGIAVKSLKDAVPVFEKIFGVKATELEYVEEQKVNVRKLHLENIDIELLEGTSPESPISKFIEKKGEGIHHCSFDVPDIFQSLSDLKNGGIELINETPRTGADDMLIAFLHPKSTNNILIELSQHKDK